KVAVAFVPICIGNNFFYLTYRRLEVVMAFCEAEMTIRPFKLPDDLPTLLALLPPSLQYPEKPSWSFATDELEGRIASLNTIQRLWPLLAFVMLLVPKLRDVLNGFIWDEDGQAVGVSNVGRQGMGDTWFIANVGVLPSYRRKGIARKVVEACVELVRE